MASTTTSLEEIASALGPGLVSERAGQVVTSPQTTEQVSAVLRYADAHGLKVEIVGAGTKRAWAGQPTGALVLETRGLQGVREHSWQDLTATVMAGTTWAEMQRTLAGHCQQVALDPLWADRATVGGIVAANDSGSLRLKYGSLRDLVIGMTLVLADGTIAHTGGKVVKNVAGYDLHKLMIGAYGTLAVVTEVTFRLHSIPRHTRIRSIISSDPHLIAEQVTQVMNSHLDVQAMQLRTIADGFALDIELAGMEQAAEAALGAPAEDTGAFAAREKLFAHEGIIVKVTMLISAIARISATVTRLGGEAVTQATGIMFARFDATIAKNALAELQSVIKAEGDGAVTVLRGADGFGTVPTAGTASPVMREIMGHFDPKRTLNAGLVVGA